MAKCNQLTSLPFKGLNNFWSDLFVHFDQNRKKIFHSVAYIVDAINDLVNFNQVTFVSILLAKRFRIDNTLQGALRQTLVDMGY